MGKYISKSLVFVLLLSLFYPLSSSALATDYNFTYRLTDVGMGVRQTGQWENEITYKKQEFSSDESVIVLSRIFNITRVDSFQFKYELSGAQNRSFFSEVYKPRGAWWPEVWSVTEFGRLEPGFYNMDVYISVNNGAYHKKDSKSIRVYYSNTYNNSNVGYSDSNYYNNYQNQNTYRGSNYDDRNRIDNRAGKCGDSVSYNVSWFVTGEGVDRRGNYIYEIEDEKDRFSRSENVYALIRSHNLKNISNFRYRFEVYKNGSAHYRTKELPTQRPNCKDWGYNYAYSNLGRLANGSYEIRAYIKFDGDDYQHVATRSITVGNATSHNTNSSNYSTNYSPQSDSYNYSFTSTANNVNFHGNYYYSVSNPQTEFSTYDEVKVLTRLSDIQNVYKFKVRHELYRDGKYVKKISSGIRYPKRDDWEYNFTQANFGRLSADDYSVKAYISVEDGAWRYLGKEDFEVKRNRSSSSSDYNYDWTIVGTDFDY